MFLLSSKFITIQHFMRAKAMIKSILYMKCANLFFSSDFFFFFSQFAILTYFALTLNYSSMHAIFDANIYLSVRSKITDLC